MARERKHTTPLRRTTAKLRDRAGEQHTGAAFELPPPADVLGHDAQPWPVGVSEDWETGAVDITRLERDDPADKRRINNAWRALKADVGADEAAQVGELFQKLRAHFPDAGIEVPAETLLDEASTR
tara:strand:- start:1261 stop:1638 length:378 start_codon:yes stop_codon:yes gene_type:complete